MRTVGYGPGEGDGDGRIPGGLDAGRELVALEAGRLLERYGAGWCVRDLDSRNGTFVNGQRVWRERPLRPGDEPRVGATRLILAEALYRFDQAAVERRPVPSVRDAEVSGRESVLPGHGSRDPR